MLKLIHVLKQQFIECNFAECNSVKCNPVEHINGNKTTKYQNRTYYFYDNIINIKDFDPKLLKLHKKSPIDISICYIGYVTKKPE